MSEPVEYEMYPILRLSGFKYPLEVSPTSLTAWSLEKLLLMPVFIRRLKLGRIHLAEMSTLEALCLLFNAL